MRIPWSGRGSSTRSGRGSSPGGRRKWRLLLVPAMGIAVICQLSLIGPAGAATAATTAKAATAGSIAPNKANELDCNAHSPKYATVRATAATCVDPVKVVNGKRLRFDDNEHYIGPRRAQRQVHLEHPGLGQHDDLPDQDPGGPARVPHPVRQRHQLR